MTPPSTCTPRRNRSHERREDELVTLANRIHMTDTAIPTFARHCRCDRIEPVADVDGTCPFCGHQLEGKPMPSKVVHKAEPAPRGESGRRMPRHAGR
jgi:hypothetical protein